MGTELEGKVFLITGGTEGIGKSAALTFAKGGATVVLVGRNKEKTERVVAWLQKESGNPRVELLLGDCSSVAEVRAIAGAFKAKHQRLDVLVNNAGALFVDHQLTPEGFERSFALNHLGYFVLTKELLELLKKTPGSRVVSTSSGAHRAGSINLETVATRPDRRAGFPAYGDSKLANILFTRALAKRLEGTGVVANCVHPGWVHTGFGLNNQGTLIARLIGLAAPLLARTPEKGAETLVWLAVSPDAASVNGQYFFNKRVASVSARARDEALAEALWALSEKVSTALPAAIRAAS
ncbi:MAG: SDR family oxidoreductase [Archangium sp.]|nr:SDR family oxidoreductase [Archangium sp.]